MTYFASARLVPCSPFILSEGYSQAEKVSSISCVAAIPRSLDKEQWDWLRWRSRPILRIKFHELRTIETPAGIRKITKAHYPPDPNAIKYHIPIGSRRGARSDACAIKTEKVIAGTGTGTRLNLQFYYPEPAGFRY